MQMNIEALVESQVTRELREMNLREIIAAEVREMISTDVGKEIVQSVKDVAKDMIAEEVRKTLDGEIRTDDGWGHKNSYPSFEVLFKNAFKEAMDKKYEVKKEIEHQVKMRVDSLIKQDYNRVLEKITDEITKSKLVKSGT